MPFSSELQLLPFTKTINLSLSLDFIGVKQGSVFQKCKAPSVSKPPLNILSLVASPSTMYPLYFQMSWLSHVIFSGSCEK